MAAKAKDILFDYVAHVQKEDGSVIEMAGSREADTPNSIYQWLVSRSQELSGFLISQSISFADVSDIIVPPPPKRPPVIVPERVEIPNVFSDREVFGVFTDTYKGASLCTYKVTKE